MQTPEHSDTYPFIVQPATSVTTVSGTRKRTAWIVRHQGDSREWGYYAFPRHAQWVAAILKRTDGRAFPPKVNAGAQS